MGGWGEVHQASFLPQFWYEFPFMSWFKSSGHSGMKNESSLLYFKLLDPVVQKVDNAIHRINR